MEKELIEFIEKNELSPFNKAKTGLRTGQSIFKTAEAKAVYNKVIAKIACNFCFADTSNLLNFFNFTGNFEEIKKRQEFFSKLNKANNSFLREIKTPRQIWQPKYDIVIATSDEDSFLELKKLGCPVRFISCQEDVSALESADIIQAVDCDEFSSLLEQLPQTIFLNSSGDAYLERFLELLSSWKENIEVIAKNEINDDVKKVVDELMPLMRFIDSGENKKISREYADEVLGEINEQLLEKVKQMTLSGDSLVNILSKSKFPDELSNLIKQLIRNTGLPEEIFNIAVPLSIDENEFARFSKQQSSNEFVDIAAEIKKNSGLLRKVPENLKRLSSLLLIFDFFSGIANFLKGNFPREGRIVEIKSSENLFLEKAQPVSFLLDETSRCSILTGANSGGKTTLLEHIIQIISLFQLGLPATGEIRMPVFTEVYYFAKNKGSMSKGAFETLLSQMSGINPGKSTLILADELEAVTEPGVAANIVCATSKYFLEKNCFLVIATHLGQEIRKNLPAGARIDGIEAKGLNEDNELVVDHNPVLGRLANSTPELIVERLAKTQSSDYFSYINNYLKSKI